MDDTLMQGLMSLFGESTRVLFELRKDTKPDDLTQGQHNILEYVYFNCSSTLSGISECLYLSMPNASREVKKLIEKGYLEKQCSLNDKRSHQIVASSKGSEVMDKVMATILKRAGERYAHLSEDEISKCIRELNHINKTLFFSR